MCASMKTSQETEGKKRLKLNIYMRRKLTIAFGMVSAVLFALALYIVVLMRNNGQDYQKLILSQQGYSTSVIPFKRGNIVDRNGTLLAYSEEVYNLILDPSVILYSKQASDPEPNRGITVDALVRCFGYDRDELNRLLDENRTSQYLRYARQLTEAQIDVFLTYQSEYNGAKGSDGKSLHKDSITGVWFETEYKRAYPYKEIACTVLGFSGSDSSEGHWGMEEYYNDALTGINGKSYSFMNQNGEYERVLQEAEDGCTVVSTIDWYIQSVVQEKIKEFIAENRYTNVGVIVMNPTTAEILAMATDKSFDPANPMDFSLTYSEEELAAMTDEEKKTLQNQMWRNFAISDAYPPGSVSKELTVAMGLEEAVVNAETIFECDGGENIQGTYIRCTGQHGTLNLEQCLWFSCNDAMMNLAARVSVATMLRYERNFGLGSRTGVDLPGEATGVIFTEDTMSAVDMATCSFGQGYSATMIQMAASYCALINGGYYYQPRIVSRILDANGGLVRAFEPELIRTVVTEETSSFMRMAAYDTVESPSTAGVGRIEGYKVGGKTGTSQKYPIEEGEYVISYMAFVPADNPQLLVYAVVDEPEHEGEEVSNRGAVLLERSVMLELLPYLGIPKEQ